MNRELIVNRIWDKLEGLTIKTVDEWKKRVGELADLHIEQMNKEYDRGTIDEHRRFVEAISKVMKD